VGTQVHNAYLGSAAEIGIPGLVLYLGMILATAGTLRRTARRARAVADHDTARTAYAFLFALFGWAITSIFLSSATSRPLWIIIGSSLALTTMVARPQLRGDSG
jgi:O-antigen ligase